MERKLAAIFSTDVQGYSRLMGDNEEATIRTLTAYREVMTQLIQHHRGRVVDTPGDNLLAEFASAVDALQAAVEIQHLYVLGNAYRLTGRYEEAITVFKRVLPVVPNVPTLHLNLAVTYSESS